MKICGENVWKIYFQKKTTTQFYISVPLTEQYGELEFPSNFLVSCALHPATYLNKLLLGSCQGQLQLWNVRTSTLIYTFSGWGSKVTSLAQSQAVDVVGIGLENGNTILHNLKFDETLMKFQQDWGPVVGISFRTGKDHQLSVGVMLRMKKLWEQFIVCLEK